MTEAEIYEFDLNGFIIYRDLIPADLVRRMNERLDADQAGAFPHSFSFLDLDPCFLELMAHPRTLNIMRHLIGDWLRLDHAYGLQMTRETAVRENLHGGLRADHGEHQYQWAYNRMWNGLIVVMYALEDVPAGAGGLIVVPGSHKAAINSYQPEVYSHLVVNPSFRAGDMLIFTEALVHGTRKWTAPGRRRALLYKYSPGYSTWADASKLQQYEALATTQLQRDLLRPPFVGGRTPLQFPEA